MFYEDVLLRAGETLQGLSSDYGHNGTGDHVWRDRRNAALVARRKTPNQLRAGDVLMIPIPWKITTHSLVAQNLSPQTGGAKMVAHRDGALGTRLSWVQTVYQANRPMLGTQTFCVDGCPPDDDLPFYWTNNEIKSNVLLRSRFQDIPQRRIDGSPISWRAVLSLAVVTQLRVTIWNSLVWGWDMNAAGLISTVGPRSANPTEVAGHLSVLRQGQGTKPLPFSAYGWTFRKAP